MNSSDAPQPRRGEIWIANTGGKKHAVVVISLDARNASSRSESILAVPFGSYGQPGPTVLRLEPGETVLPEHSFLKAHFISVIRNPELLQRLPRRLSQTQMRKLVAAVNRAIDPALFLTLRH